MSLGSNTLIWCTVNSSHESRQHAPDARWALNCACDVGGVVNSNTGLKVLITRTWVRNSFFKKCWSILFLLNSILIIQLLIIRGQRCGSQIDEQEWRWIDFLIPNVKKLFLWIRAESDVDLDVYSSRRSGSAPDSLLQSWPALFCFDRDTLGSRVVFCV